MWGVRRDFECCRRTIAVSGPLYVVCKQNNSHLEDVSRVRYAGMIVLVSTEGSTVLFASARRAPSRQDKRRSRLRQEGMMGLLRGPEGEQLYGRGRRVQDNTACVFIV